MKKRPRLTHLEMLAAGQVPAALLGATALERLKMMSEAAAPPAAPSTALAVYVASPAPQEGITVVTPPAGTEPYRPHREPLENHVKYIASAERNLSNTTIRRVFELASAIQRALDDTGLTQKQLAKEIGRSLPYVKKYVALAKIGSKERAKAEKRCKGEAGFNAVWRFFFPPATKPLVLSAAVAVASEAAPVAVAPKAPPVVEAPPEVAPPEVLATLAAAPVDAAVDPRGALVDAVRNAVATLADYDAANNVDPFADKGVSTRTIDETVKIICERTGDEPDEGTSEFREWHTLVCNSIRLASGDDPALYYPIQDRVLRFKKDAKAAARKAAKAAEVAARKAARAAAKKAPPLDVAAE